MKIKVFGKDNVGWSIDKDRANLIYFLSKIENVELTENTKEADIFFFVWLDFLMSGRFFLFRVFRKIFWKNKKIISWVTNDVTQNKNFLKKKYPIDLFIAPSEKVSLFLNQHSLKNIKIPFFVSPEIYYQKNLPKIEILKKLNLREDLKDKFLIGSFQRDGEGKNLLSPKWQKNPDLLIEICKNLPKDKFTLVLAGPRRHYVIKRCLEENIPYVFVGDESFVKNLKDDIFQNNQKEDLISDLYNLVDLYLVTSKSEGGPKAVLEAALSKTMIFSSDVGFAKDYLHPECLLSENNVSEIAEKVLKVIDGKNIEDIKNYNFEKSSFAMDFENYKSLLEKAIKTI